MSGVLETATYYIAAMKLQRANNAARVAAMSAHCARLHECEHAFKAKQMAQ